MPLAVGFQDYDPTKVLKSARVPISISPQVQGSQMVQRMANKLKVSVRSKPEWPRQNSRLQRFSNSGYMEDRLESILVLVVIISETW